VLTVTYCFGNKEGGIADPKPSMPQRKDKGELSVVFRVRCDFRNPRDCSDVTELRSAGVCGSLWARCSPDQRRAGIAIGIEISLGPAYLVMATISGLPRKWNSKPSKKGPASSNHPNRISIGTWT
jgi:hypothetical protein